jgi:transcriptional regulator with XRE-family HTH domain
MSNSHSGHVNMRFTALDRKMALRTLNISGRQIGRECGVDASLVSHVIAGRRWMGSPARRVMQHMAELIGAPMDDLFPGHDRRKGWARRGEEAPDQDEAKPAA